MEFRDILQKIRKERKLSQEDLAQQLDISRQAVAKWESGLAFPDIKNLIQMSELLCVTIDSLVKDNSECSNRQIIPKRINQDKVKKFLKLAISNTYAGNGKKSEVSSRPNSSNYIYQQDHFKYMDTYVGGECFSGEVVVFDKDMPIWAMNYTGRSLEEQFSGDFLNEALLAASEDMPTRGPKVYRKGNYIYYNTTDGDFHWFQGKEEICCKDLKVYECFFHGGLVK